jgi:hypothetical protein
MEQDRMDTAKQTWRDVYKAAIAEVNPTEVRWKIDLACAAILQRIDALTGARDLSAMEEQREILDSLNNLRKLQRPESQGSADANQLTPCRPQEQQP